MSPSNIKLKNTVSFIELKNKFRHKNKKNKEAYFFNSNKTIFNSIYNNIDKILQDNTINLKNLLESDIFIKLQQKNIKNINEDGIINKEITEDIINLLNQCIVETNLTQDNRVINEDYNEKFIDCNIIDNNIDEIQLLPTKKLDKTGLMYNLFKDKNIKFIYNPKLNNTQSNNKYISKRKFRLTSSYISKIKLPTKYKITCKYWIYPKKEDNFEAHYCNQIKEISPVDGEHSKLKCPNNHEIKNLDKATPEEMVDLYIYYIEDITNNYYDDDIKENIVAFSFEEIDEEEIICNAVPSFDNKSAVTNYFILGYKSLNEKQPLKHPIILKEEQPIFLLDIFKSIQNYFKEYHQEKITHQNKILANIMIFQYLSQRYFKTLYPALVLGKSSSGKSFWYNVLDKIILKNSIKVEPSVRRNKFIAGQSGISINNTKLFLPGYVNTKDFIFINEMAGKLEEYMNNSSLKNFDEDNNLFGMHKQCYDSGDNNSVDIGIQGSEEIKINAVPFSVGNFTTLKTNKKRYLTMLKKQYTILNQDNNKKFSVKTPMFKSINYYLHNLNNKPLAQAHQKVRDLYDSYFMTGLDIAEQSRFSFFIVIDPQSEQTKISTPSRSQLGKIKKQTHKKEMIEELDEIFKPGLKKHKQKEIFKFLNDVFKWSWEYYQTTNNQYRFDVGEVPGHLHNSLGKMNGDLLLLHKIYYNQDLIFTEEDKQMLIYFNSFNYNFLTTKEASMVEKPQTNFMKIDVDDVDRSIDKGVEIIKQKEKEREENSIEIDEDFEDVMEGFGEIPEELE